MILAHVRIDDDDYDWFDGPCEFPVLPPIGGTIRIIDRNANMRELRVTGVVVEGVKPKTKEEWPSVFAEQRIMILSSEF